MIDPGASAKAAAGLNVLVLSPTPTHPQDFGNRKRIFRVCKRFADEGAHIIYIHYPAELEWRGRVPASAERAMQQCWDHYYTVGPTRMLHTDPVGQQHSIDEWWDEAIGGFLRWIFSVQQVDVFIVNYSWLSKAFEYAPAGTFKILDTHDKVSGRHVMLASLGVGPEFFYTDEAQEAIAFRRADLVWAIKDAERALFEQMAPTPVLTLQHLDPPRALERPAPDADGFLRVGIIGARNNVNRMNITEFLKVALPLIERSFAPVKIVVAGTVCDLLEGIDSPFVELRGKVGDVEEFYRSVDCAAVPMRASTGLKIKAGEALSLGVPLLSLAHAFEGYTPSSPFHELADFTALANAMIDLSFAPRGELDALAQASRTSYAKTENNIDASLKQTIERAHAYANSIVLTIDSRALVPGNILHLLLESVHDYLRDFGAIKILVVSGSANHVVGRAHDIERFGRLFVAADVPGAHDLRGPLSEIGATVADLERYLAKIRPKMIVVDALHPALAKIALPETVVVSRAEVIAVSQNSTPAWIPGRESHRAIAAAPAISRDVAALAAAARATPIALPCFRFVRLAKVKSAQEVEHRKTMAILGSADSPAVNIAIEMARVWQMEPFVITGLDEDATKFLVPGGAASVFKADAYLDSLLSLRAHRPYFAMDLSNGRAGLGLCREVLERLRVPLVSGSASGTHPSLIQGARPFHAGTERELWNAMRSLALDSDESRRASFLRAWNELESGKGWMWFGRFCAELFGTEKRAAA